MSETIIAERTFTVKVDSKRTLVARAAITHLGNNNDNYFHITGYMYTMSRVSGEPYHPGLGYIESCGMLHDEIREHIPELVPYLKWHGVGVKFGPMHYIANSLYWRTEGNVEYFKSTCVFGAVEGDEDFDVMESSAEETAAWLDQRRPALLGEFHADMEVLL